MRVSPSHIKQQELKSTEGIPPFLDADPMVVDVLVTFFFSGFGIPCTL